jgi:putative ABC transport system permease protein
MQNGGRIEYVKLFSIVALFILAIACINFMNLATARSVKRAKEVGVRKVVGAYRNSLMGQFLGESMLITLFALVFSVLIVLLLLPVFSTLTEKHLSLDFSNLTFLVLLVSLSLITGLVSGSYPALFMASLNPVVILKGSLTFKSSATYFRKGLVILQFSLSIMLIFGTLVVYRQIQFIQTKNLGYNRENLLYMLSKEFIQLVLLAAFIAFPLGWYFLSGWLGKYACRIDIKWWYFLVVTAIAVLIALVTVSFQSIKAALMNPVKSLRTE